LVDQHRTFAGPGGHRTILRADGDDGALARPATLDAGRKVFAFILDRPLKIEAVLSTVDQM